MSAPTIGIDHAAAELFTGYGTEAAVVRMTSDMLTIRLVLLRALITEVTAHHPEIADAAGLSDAYRVLTELEGSHPGAVEALLAYPHTGVWLGRVLQRLRNASDDREPTPLWADCGYLGWLAAAAVVTNLPSGSMRVVVRNGEVMLPGVGMARVGSAGDYGHCMLNWGDGAIRIVADDSAPISVASPADESDPAWLPLRRLHGGNGEPEVVLDDLDPFRDLPSGTAPRLTTDEFHTWRKDFAQAWHVLQRDFPGYLTPMRACLRLLTPLTARPVAATVGHTAFSGTGCVYTTAPKDSCEMAVSLIHEIQHSKLAMLADQVLIVDPDPTCRFYAPWRDDPRPILGLLHGIYAFFGVTDFWRVHRHADCHRSMRAHIEFERGRTQLATAMEQASGSGLLTESGEEFLSALTAGVRPWADEDVPAEARDAVAEILVAHRTSWQVRNRTSDDAELAELAELWVARAEPPAELPSIRYVDQETIPDRHRDLHIPVRLRMHDPAAASSVAPAELPRGTRAYLAGEPAEAVELYALDLRVDPLLPQLWAGLASSLPELFPDTDFGVLNDRAEVAARLYQRLLSDGTETDVVELVRWLSDRPRTDI